MTYLDFYEVASNRESDLMKRLRVAVVIWALQVSALPLDAPNREAKVRFASEVVADSAKAALKVVWFVLADGTLRSVDPNTVTDQQMQTTVNNLLETYAQEALTVPALDSILR